MTVRLLHGDCRKVMAGLPECSVDAIVTDPPYELGFMGKKWDRTGVAFDPKTWDAALRVLKPGGHLLAFSGTRTYHRMACAIEDAGFEIRDQIGNAIASDTHVRLFLESLSDEQRTAFMQCVDDSQFGGQLAWVFGSGFPKSLNVSMAIDSRKDWAALHALQGKVRAAREALGISQSEAARRMGLIAPGERLGGGGFMWFETGMRVPTREQYPALKAALCLDDGCDLAFEAAEREVVGQHRASAGGQNMRAGIGGTGEALPPGEITEPSSEDAKRWAGWGTALKPAWEPIVLARKPLIGTVAANVLQHGTGALNIDGCRVEASAADIAAAAVPMPMLHVEGDSGHALGARTGRNGDRFDMSAGRWPANVIHDGSDEVLAAFPQSDGAHSSVRGAAESKAGFSGGWANRAQAEKRGDTGSAARFFKECQWDDPPSTAPTAEAPLSLQSALGVSVASAAATWASLAGVLDESCPGPSMSVTGSEFETLCACAITAMTHIGSGFSPDQRLEKRSQCGSLASVAAIRAQTGITTITASLCRSDGCAGSATFTITPSRLDRGDLDSGGRLYYSAKASAHDRHEGLQHPGPQFKAGRMPHDGEQVERELRGNHHPTVKPTELMRYLCRLITPPGGTVLDPFAGSGSTLKAAELEGFDAIGIELDPSYVAIAQRRIASDAPLFRDLEVSAPE